MDANMPTLYFTCPATQQKVSTGESAPTLCAALELARRDSDFLKCPDCGEAHQWVSLVVYLEEEPVATD
jgi:hypothetical protein